MKEGLIKDSIELLLKELQTFVTIAYLFMVGIGMLFNYQKYDEFGINIFQYADIFDFLIAPFEDFWIILFALGTLILTLIIMQIDKRWRKKSPKSYSKANFGFDKKSWFPTYRLVSYLSVFIIYLFVISILYAESVSDNINDRTPIQVKYTDNTSEKYILIGKTSSTLFLKKGSTVSIIPIDSNVKEIVIK